MSTIWARFVTPANSGVSTRSLCRFQKTILLFQAERAAYLRERIVDFLQELQCVFSRGNLDQTKLCAHSTAHARFQEWVEAGVFLKLWQAGVEQFDELCGIDWDWLSMDGAMTKAPLGGEKTGPNPTDRDKCGVKRSVLTEGHGVPIAVEIDGANRHDMKLTRSTLSGIVVDRPEPTEAKPQGMCLDKGYDYDEVRDILHDFGFTAHIRPRGEEAKAIKREVGFKARRWVVERAHSWINRFRRLLVRWDKKPANYLAFLHFACGLIAFRAAGLFG